MNRVERVSETPVYSNEYGTLYDDGVIWPSGRSGRHLRLRMGDGNPGVVVIPRYHHLLGIVRTFRYPIGAEQWGFPRGFAHGSDPLASAKAELAEEMGLSGEAELVGWFTPDSGILETRVAVVVVDVVRDETSINDHDEVSDARWVGLDELSDLLGSPGWDDGMTMAALSLLSAKSHEA